MRMKLNILFEDPLMLILYKPAGLAVQSAGVGKQDCVSLLKNYLYEKNPRGGEPYLGVVHRLDQPVEGLVVFARTAYAAGELSRQLTDGRMQKYYLALCTKWTKCGQNGGDIPAADTVDIPVDNEITYVDYLLKNQKSNYSEVVSEHTKGARRAELHVRLLKEFEDEKLVEIKLITGRHHQIRVQLAHHGNPLAGDVKYNPQAVEEKNVDNSAGARENVALCAYRLEVIHPKTKEKISMEICPKQERLQAAYSSWKETGK